MYTVYALQYVTMATVPECFCPISKKEGGMYTKGSFELNNSYIHFVSFTVNQKNYEQIVAISKAGELS
jgi:hypothetical protein